MSRIKYIIAGLIFSCSMTLMSQTRTALEQDRMQLMQELESHENNLLSIKKNKAQILSEIVRLENGTTLIPREVPVMQPVKKASTKSIQNSSLLTNTYLNLLQEKIKFDWLFRNEDLTPKLADEKLKREAQLRQLSTYITQIEETGANDLNEHTKTTTQIVTPQEHITSEKNISELMTEISALTDKEARHELGRLEIMQKVNDINLQIDRTLGKQNAISQNPQPQNQQRIIEETQTVYSPILRKKGFLPWPLDNSKIVSRYTADKNGIDIKSSDVNAKTISEGHIEQIQRSGSGSYTVTVAHAGNIRSVYANLQNVSVAEGTPVFDGSVLGTITQGKTLHFELWEDSKSLNPNHWLKNN